jgi:CheY-like chemotaxis protein
LRRTFFAMKISRVGANVWGGRPARLPCDTADFDGQTSFAAAQRGVFVELESSSCQLKKVLFVDDESMLVTLGDAMLDALGYEPAAFAKAEEAIAAFRANPEAYAAAFTDLTMPVMSGFDVARELLTIRHNLPVFVMSGNVDRDDEQRARELGVREIVMKPVSLSQLRDMLARVA